AVGTAGSGDPDLTIALGRLTADTQSYKGWCVPFTDTSNLNRVVAHIIAQDAAPIEKGQVVHFPVTGALPADPTTGVAQVSTPQANSSELFAVPWYQGATVRAGEIGARTSAMVAGAAFQGQNFNGYVLKSSVAMPIGVPARNRRPTSDTINLAI